MAEFKMSRQAKCRTNLLQNLSEIVSRGRVGVKPTSKDKHEKVVRQIMAWPRYFSSLHDTLTNATLFYAIFRERHAAAEIVAVRPVPGCSACVVETVRTDTVKAKARPDAFRRVPVIMKRFP